MTHVTFLDQVSWDPRETHNVFGPGQLRPSVRHVTFFGFGEKGKKRWEEGRKRKEKAGKGRVEWEKVGKG